MKGTFFGVILGVIGTLLVQSETGKKAIDVLKKKGNDAIKAAKEKLEKCESKAAVSEEETAGASEEA